MSLELDHLFVWTSPGAPEIDRLRELGFSEGRANTHHGQGTACRCIFFQNAYLEFLWIDDPVAANSELVRPLHLWDRSQWKENGSSPFGIGLRSSHSPDGSPAQLSFPIWEYRAPYHPPDVHLDIATSSDSLTEPLIFHSAFGLRPDAWPIERRQPLVHPAGLSSITGLSITSPGDSPRSEARERLQADGLIDFRVGPGQIAEVSFGGPETSEYLDLRPLLPLSLRW